MAATLATASLPDDDEDDARSDDARSVDSRSAGSLVDFVVDDDEEPPAEENPQCRGADEDAGLDASLILPPGTKRQRRAPDRYATHVYSSDEYRGMVLEDVPAEELYAAVGDDVEEEEEDEDDESYEGGESEEDDSDDASTTDEECPSEPAPTPSPSGGARAPAGA